MNTRPTWDQYFMSIAELVSTRSTCIRRKVGCVLVKDKRILATGYNGAPASLSHCTQETCLRTSRDVPSGVQQELCRGLHAEQNVIIQAAVHGVRTGGATVYCTHKPCILCAKMLINAQVVRIVYKNPYPDPFGDELLREGGVNMCIFGEDCGS